MSNSYATTLPNRSYVMFEIVEVELPPQSTFRLG
jgi:hypothetical protein